jgi:serine/threonine protein kinase
VLHQIGNGALGPVFRAYDSERDRLVAIKVFRLDLPPERVHQLVDEFEKLIGAELQHPVIAAPRATGIDAGNNAFLAQDFAAADSLDTVMRENGPAPMTQTLRIASQLADALDYAADRQILHGALHPRDILLSEDDIRIAGLGVSRALERVGVPSPVRRPYSAPERINDEGWDRRADVFSLAAIVYELLTGHRVAGIGSEAAESLTDVAGCDMAALRRVFALALAADPEYRFGTATAFTDALKDAVASTSAVDDIDVDVDIPSVSPRKPRSKRPRTKLRVVAPILNAIDEPAQNDADAVIASPVDALAHDVEQPELELAIHDEPIAADVDSLPLLEFAPERCDDLAIASETPDDLEVEPAETVSTSGGRKVPAPTPVAIESVASAPAIVDDEPEETPDLSLAEVAAVEQPDLIAFADTPTSVAPIEEPLPLVEPQAVEEAAPQPEPIALPLEPRLPAFLNPEFSPPLPVTAAPSHSSIWPIGVAAVIGVAVGFGVGYTVAIRDRVVVAPIAATPPAVVAAQPTRKETVAAPAPTPVGVEASPVVAPTHADAPAPVPVVPFDGRVLVRSAPSGARVFVDGKDRGQTPAAIAALARGEHRIRVVREGYTTAERRVVLSPSRPEQSLSVPLAPEPRSARSALSAPSSSKPNARATEEAGPASLKPAEKPAAEAGTLVVESRPAGAAVLVDGRRVGTTPLDIGDVRAGNHAIRIERDGYRTWAASVTVAGGEQHRVTASLEK